ncbi:hypothetical protein GZL_06081 [Streptomyces sp. 769]|nr:hypothetical protein GZL_06081 [Streptomyces sp. 769]
MRSRPGSRGGQGRGNGPAECARHRPAPAAGDRIGPGPARPSVPDGRAGDALTWSA